MYALAGHGQQTARQRPSSHLLPSAFRQGGPRAGSCLDESASGAFAQRRRSGREGGRNRRVRRGSAPSEKLMGERVARGRLDTPGAKCCSTTSMSPPPVAAEDRWARPVDVVDDRSWWCGNECRQGRRVRRACAGNRARKATKVIKIPAQSVKWAINNDKMHLGKLCPRLRIFF